MALHCTKGGSIFLVFHAVSVTDPSDTTFYPTRLSTMPSFRDYLQLTKPSIMMLVVVTGEFGRTPKINKKTGRDHWGAVQSTVLCGGGIRGGQVHGSSDRDSAYPTSKPVSPEDMLATMHHALGISPESEIRDAHLESIDDISDFVDTLVQNSKVPLKICVLPEGPQTIPYVQQL